MVPGQGGGFDLNPSQILSKPPPPGADISIKCPYLWVCDLFTNIINFKIKCKIAPGGDKNQSQFWSNAPPPGDKLSFKSGSIPHLSPTLPRDHGGGGFIWLVHKCCFELEGVMWMLSNYDK